MQLPAPSYDEQAVPQYELPELLVCANGKRVGSARQWQKLRRPELLEAFRRHVYGRFELTLDARVEVVVNAVPSHGGLSRRSELDLKLSKPGSADRSTIVRVLLFTPAGEGPFPTLLGLNLFGNQTVDPDPQIRLAQGWLPENVDLGLTGHRATDTSRGMHASRFPVEMLVSRGYALATAYVGDIDPDFDDGFRNGIHGLLAPEATRQLDAPGSIAAWAFGLSRIREALSAIGTLDAARVIVFGHSRLGKAALWAAAEDSSFALAISNESGCGGATLSRRRFGERLLHINERFPHWFCPAFHAFNEREHELPVDQHQLLALIAPRPLYVASAAADLWADPRGEELACRAAAPAYELFGLGSGLGSERIGYHLRPGQHDIKPIDFWHYLAFADRHLGPRIATP